MTAFPVLPEHPGLAAYSDLTGSLQVLGCAHIAVFILAGRPLPFRILDGVFVKSGRFTWRRADASYLEQVRLDWHLDPDPRRRAAADHVIDLIQHTMAGNPQALRQLALFQIRELLRLGEKDGSTPAELRTQILDLGVVDDEAELLASAVAATRDAPDPDTVVELIAARRSNELRRAAVVASSLDSAARDHVLLAYLSSVQADNRRVDELLAAGSRLKDDGDLEKAAVCYLRAAALVADEPQVDIGLQQCAPPPPRELTADRAGHRVILSWQPAEASTGPITYRVTRDTEPPYEVAHGPAISAVDQDPPLGPKIAYRVVTVRAARVESPPAVTGRFRVLPDVEDFTLTEQRGYVIGFWRMPPNVADVRATRHSGDLRGDGDQIAVQPGCTSFRDGNVAPGTSYLYRVTCGYKDPEGGLAWSAGQSSTVQASEWPTPVTELQVVAGREGKSVCLQWRSPAAGKIIILLGSSAAPAEGSELASTEIGSLGAVAWRGAAGPEGGPMRCEIPLSGTGVHHLSVVTVLAQRAVVGATRIIHALEGFQELRARRAGENIQLTWPWPPSSPVTLALVRWNCVSDGTSAESASQVSRENYRRREVLISARGCGYQFAITPLSPITGSVSVGPPAIDELGPQHDLAYEIIRTRRGLRVRRTARLRAADLPAVPLEFLLIARLGTLRPTQASQGTIVLQVSGEAISEGSPAEHWIDLSAVRPPYYLLGFLAGPAAPQVRLIHPSRTQLLVER